MAQTRMFRDRVVSMEQTLEGGEKYLPLLKELCREAFPELEFRDCTLDHERDLFIMSLEGPNGTTKRIGWTRMVLFDAERIPTLIGDPASRLRTKIVDHLRAHASRSEIVVTFRHLEEGWVDSPEPRHEGRRRRRGGRGGGRGAERGAPGRRPAGPPAAAPAQKVPPPQRGLTPPSRGPAEAAPSPPGGKRRRRFRRRRGGRGAGGGSPNPAAPAGRKA